MQNGAVFTDFRASFHKKFVMFEGDAFCQISCKAITPGFDFCKQGVFKLDIVVFWFNENGFPLPLITFGVFASIPIFDERIKSGFIQKIAGFSVPSYFRHELMLTER